MNVQASKLVQRNRWMDWTPKARIMADAADSEPTKPTKPGFDGFVAPPPGKSPIRPRSLSDRHLLAREREQKAELLTELTRRRRKAIDKLNTMVQPQDRLVVAPDFCPFLPRGVRLIRYQPKEPPIGIDVCSVVTDVDRFIRAELRELDGRLNNPVQIRGGWGVFAILERLRQAGLELEIVPPQ
jgi:hypothetical protein